MTSEFEDLEALLGVTIEPSGTKRRKEALVECGQTPPKARPRFTEWNNFHSFELGGYVALVKRFQCACCERSTDLLTGVFVEEIHRPTGTRRLTQLAKGGDWPMGVDYRKEVEGVEVPYCALCIGDLGFSQEVDSKGQPWTLRVKG